MVHLRALVFCLIAAAALVAGCGSTDKTVDPLLNSVDKAHSAQALSALQQAQVSAALVKTESGGTYGGGAEDLAQKLQAKDPSKRFSTAPSSGPEQVQVLGGGGAAILVAQGAADVYVAIWDDGNGTPMYYVGKQPPPFSAQRPSGGGWSSQPPT
jgi:hypothetical protein